jgi:hypothetical protein
MYNVRAYEDSTPYRNAIYDIDAGMGHVGLTVIPGPDRRENRWRMGMPVWI